MKKLFALSVLLFLASYTFAQTNPVANAAVKQVDPNAAVMTVENETIDYGDVVKGTDDGKRVFKFKNTGKSPLTIDVKSTCGCTVPNYSKDPIMPGESGEVTVQYNMNPGRFSKTIIVTTNGNPEKVNLRIKGNIIDPNAPVPVEQQKSMLAK